MSVYSKGKDKNKKWRYDFMVEGVRYSSGWKFVKKKDAQKTMVEHRKEVSNPQDPPETATDMDFLELVNRRLDHMQAYCSQSHYTDYRYRARKWIKRWGHLPCSEVTRDKIQPFVLKRAKVSACTANRELVSFRALFNFGIEEGYTATNPTTGIKFLPVENRKIKPDQRHLEFPAGDN